MGIRVRVLVAGIPPDGAITAAVFPNLSHAVRAIAERAQEQWLDFADGAPLPDGKIIQNRTGEYARSIALRTTGDFSAEVYSELPYADAIERGTPQRDMKDILRTSLKVRLTKDGRRYLIIPFRHNGPTSVQGSNTPVEVWNWWKKPGRKSSRVVSQHTRVSGTGAYDIHTREPIRVAAWRYQWGSRLTKTALASLGHEPDSRMSKRMQGMVRFASAKGNGGASHSQLMTFRIMMEGSPGWIMPAQPGKYPARETEKLIEPVAEEVFGEAVKADVVAILGAED